MWPLHRLHRHKINIDRSTRSPAVSNGTFTFWTHSLLRDRPSLHCRIVRWEGPPPPGAPNRHFLPPLLTSERWQNVHKPQVSYRPTRKVWFKREAYSVFWSAKGFGKAIELLIALWLFLFWQTMPAGLHDLHYKRKRKNILSITASCREYTLLLTIHRRVTLPCGGVKFGHVDSQENH